MGKAKTRLQVGFRRLAVFLGCMASLAWLAFLGYILIAEGPPRPDETWILVLMIVAGAAPFAGVWALTVFVGWVIRGFFERGSGPSE